MVPVLRWHSGVVVVELITWLFGHVCHLAGIHFRLFNPSNLLQRGCVQTFSSIWTFAFNQHISKCRADLIEFGWFVVPDDSQIYLLWVETGYSLSIFTNKTFHTDLDGHLHALRVRLSDSLNRFQVCPSVTCVMVIIHMEAGGCCWWVNNRWWPSRGWET